MQNNNVIKNISKVIVFIVSIFFNSNVLFANEPAMEQLGNHETNNLHDTVFEPLQGPDQSRFHVGMAMGVNRLGFGLKTTDNLEELGFRSVKSDSDLGFHIGLLVSTNGFNT